jgi:hypothetical protein
MNRTTVAQALNGGYIEEYNLDMRRNRFTMRVDVLENSALSRYALLFEKISRFEFRTDSKSDAGDRLQLTEMSIDLTPEQSSSEEWEVTMSMFDMSYLTLRCSLILVGGEAMR